MGKIILWGILLLILVRALMRLGRAFMGGAIFSRPGGRAPSVHLVKDPVCGVFVAPSQALAAGSGRDVQFFCSERCRNEWTLSSRSQR